MKYMISSISDVVTEEGGDDWESVMYVDRTAPLARESGLGIEIAEFCISQAGLLTGIQGSGRGF